MWFAIIAGIVSLAVSIIMFTPPLRPFPFYKSFAFFFMFEGLWCLFNGAIQEIMPYAGFMTWIQYAGIIVFVGYIFYSVFSFHRSHPKDAEPAIEENNKIKKIKSVRVSEKSNSGDNGDKESKTEEDKSDNTTN